MPKVTAEHSFNPTPRHSTIIAIDPGKAGGIAWRHFGYAPCCVPMPETPQDVCCVLRSIFSTDPQFSKIVFMEQIVKHMGAGIPASTMAVYASNYGVVMGAVIYAGARLELVRPQDWQKGLGLGITGRQKAQFFTTMDAYARKAEKKRIRLLNGQLKRDWKRKLQDNAQRLFPDLAAAGLVTLSTCDALLLLEFGRREEAQTDLREAKEQSATARIIGGIHSTIVPANAEEIARYLEDNRNCE